MLLVAASLLARRHDQFGVQYLPLTVGALSWSGNVFAWVKD
jgi:hypothetical protein